MRIPHRHWWKKAFRMPGHTWYRCRWFFCRELGYEIPQ